MQYCNIQTRYLANEKRDKAAAVAALEELKAASSRQKEALETRIAKVKASKAKAVKDLKFDCESMKRWIDNLTSEIKCDSWGKPIQVRARISPRELTVPGVLP